MTALRTLSAWAVLLIAVAACQPWGCQRAGTEIEGPAPVQLLPGMSAGLAASAETDRPILCFFTAEWCGWCDHMKQTALSDPKVARLAQRFVCVLVDTDQEAGVARRYSVQGLPTVVFTTTQGAELGRVVGAQSPENLAAAMRSALNRVAWVEKGSVVR
ncbi:MAG: thioredoxin family protein [Planctomycetota bacterium]